MAEIRLRDQLWQSFVRVARSKQKRPEVLAENVLSEFVERAADEDLLRRSAKTARRSPLTVAQIEAGVKARRRARS